MVEARRRRQTPDAPLDDVRVLIVESGYYEDIADLLLAGARRALDSVRAAYDVVTVPGALEIPQAVALTLAAPHDAAPYDGVVALGCVIRGETSHYDIVAGESARALLDVCIAASVPVGNGILTVDTPEQARRRADPGGGDKGGTAAAAALALVRLKRGGIVPAKPR